MGHETIGLLGAGFWLFVGLMWVAVFAATLALPFALLSMTRNIRHIRTQLERLNDTLDSRGRGSAGGIIGI